MLKFATKIAKLKRKLGFKHHIIFLPDTTTEEELLMRFVYLEQIQGFKVGHYVYEPEKHIVALRLDLKK